jgi:nucleoside-diphosphate-sugar epimerase
VVEANLRAVEAPASASGEVFNIACGEPTTVNRLAQEINRLAGATLDAAHLAPRTGEIRHSFADISKARAVLFFQPRVSFREGLGETVAWYKGRS